MIFIAHYEVKDSGYNLFSGPKDDMQSMKLGGANWVVNSSMKEQFDSKFYQLSLVNGKASGGQVKQIMLQYGLSNDILARIWELSDLDKDGSMNAEEFALCCYLLESVKNGKQLPQQLPDAYIPPSFRKSSNFDQTNYFQAPNNNNNSNNNNNNSNQNYNNQNNNYNQNNNNNNNNNNNYSNQNQNYNDYNNNNNNNSNQQQQQAPPMMSSQQQQQHRQASNEYVEDTGTNTGGYGDDAGAW